MSNVIKAAAITYTKEKRTIDSNPRAAEFTRLFVEKHAAVKEEEAMDGLEALEDGFEPGLSGLQKDQVQEDTGPDPEEVRKQIEEDVAKVLEEAKAEVEQMLSQAEAEAADIKKKAKAQATEQGYKEGYQKAEAEFSKAKKALEAEAAENRRAYERQVKELEPAFVEMVIRLVEKLTGVLLEDKSGIVFYLLEQAMSGLDMSMTYLLHVSAEDYEFVNSKKADLAWNLKEGATIEVAVDSTLGQGGCIIETDSRVFDCSIDTQLKNLASDLRLLAGIRESAVV